MLLVVSVIPHTVPEKSAAALSLVLEIGAPTYDEC